MCFLVFPTFFLLSRTVTVMGDDSCGLLFLQPPLFQAALGRDLFLAPKAALVYDYYYFYQEFFCYCSPLPPEPRLLSVPLPTKYVQFSSICVWVFFSCPLPNLPRSFFFFF